MSPKGKKHKIAVADEDAPSPTVVFQSPGLKPDVRLKVFGQEYHAHSVILKLYSNYFRKFLDSPEKAPVPDTALFRYDYVAIVDEDDGNWGLEVATEENNSPNLECLKYDQADEETAFMYLLSAIYQRKYTISSMQEFYSLIRLADFYCALPAMSASLFKVLWDDTPNFTLEISTHSEDMLRFAKKLRHPILFREALVHVVSSWTPECEAYDDDEELKAVVVLAHSRVMYMILMTNLEMMKNNNYQDSITYAFDEISGMTITEETNNPTGAACASYYREIWKKFHNSDEGADPTDGLAYLGALRALLSSKLVLGKGNFVAGTDGMGFLCAEVEDEDLPWNESIDW